MLCRYISCHIRHLVRTAISRCWWLLWCIPNDYGNAALLGLRACLQHHLQFAAQLITWDPVSTLRMRVPEQIMYIVEV